MTAPSQAVAGLMPVGKREAYMGAGFQKQAGRSGARGNRSAAARSPHDLFWSKVTEPWKKFLEQSAPAKLTKVASSMIAEDPAADPQPIV